MDTALERHCERLASRDRTMPKAPGLNAGQLTGEMSTGPNRLSDKRRSLSQATAHVAKSSKRYGVRPSSGKVSDLETGMRPAGKDDGSDYFAEWRDSGGILQLPKAKTRMQDKLRTLCIAWIAGERPEGVADLIRDAIATVGRTDPKQASAFRVPMLGAGLYKG